LHIVGLELASVSFIISDVCMKGRIRFIILFCCGVTMGMLWQSCDRCDNLECDTDSYHGQFRIVSAIDGTDLVFGNNRIYDKDKIRFYALKGSDTSVFEYSTVKFGNIGYDSILYVYFFPRTDLAYMDLGNGDVDTLGISYETINDRCCGAITEITNYRFNNRVDIPGNRGTQAIRK
jgi:hypothetical protein